MYRIANFEFKKDKEMSENSILKDSIILHGYAVANFTSYDDFCKAVSLLGKTIDVSEIRFQSQARALLASNNAMNLHTDHPSADLVSWYCVQNADAGGESIFVDYKRVLDHLSFDEIENLKKIIVRVPRTRFSDESIENLLSNKGLYFADWLVRIEERSIYTELLDKFVKLLNSYSINIRLENGSALFLDNKRVLHGRNSFVNSAKTRHLIRHWISYCKLS